MTINLSSGQSFYDAVLLRDCLTKRLEVCNDLILKVLSAKNCCPQRLRTLTTDILVIRSPHKTIMQYLALGIIVILVIQRVETQQGLRCH